MNGQVRESMRVAPAEIGDLPFVSGSGAPAQAGPQL
jgi:hypothetical protein